MSSYKRSYAGYTWERTIDRYQGHFICIDSWLVSQYYPPAWQACHRVATSFDHTSSRMDDEIHDLLQLLFWILLRLKCLILSHLWFSDSLRCCRKSLSGFGWPAWWDLWGDSCSLWFFCLFLLLGLWWFFVFGFLFLLLAVFHPGRTIALWRVDPLFSPGITRFYSLCRSCADER